MYASKRLLLILATLICGCSSGAENEIVPPINPPDLETAFVRNVVVSMKQCGQPANSRTIFAREPIVFSIDFEFDAALNWDVAVLEVLHEPNERHPNGVAFTAWLGNRQHGESENGTTRKWNFATAWSERAPNVRISVKPGEYALQISLHRHAKTVAEKVAELEDSSQHRTPIWNKTVAIDRRGEALSHGAF
jgi:hypothetical protein